MAQFPFLLLLLIVSAFLDVPSSHCETTTATRSTQSQHHHHPHHEAQAPAPASRRAQTLHFSDCPAACLHRCSNASKHKPCIFYCNLCCSRCLCVPPGTYGNKDVCPCYNNMKNSRGGPKCP